MSEVCGICGREAPATMLPDDDLCGNSGWYNVADGVVCHGCVELCASCMEPLSLTHIKHLDIIHCTRCEPSKGKPTGPFANKYNDAGTVRYRRCADDLECVVIDFIDAIVREYYPGLETTTNDSGYAWRPAGEEVSYHVPPLVGVLDYQYYYWRIGIVRQGLFIHTGNP